MYYMQNNETIDYTEYFQGYFIVLVSVYLFPQFYENLSIFSFIANKQQITAVKVVPSPKVALVNITYTSLFA